MSVKPYITVYCSLFFLILFSTSCGSAFGFIKTSGVETDGIHYRVLSEDRPLRQQITSPNTVYDIRHLFDLKGAKLTIPDNCILVFNGGMICNGTIYGNNTVVRADAVKIFDKDIVIGGSWGEFTVCARWFGNTTNDIQKSISSFENKVINIDGQWIFNGTIEVPYDTYLQVNNGAIKASSKGTIMRIYAGDKEINLQNLRIDLEKSYEGTCVELYGCNHPDIRGFLKPLEKNISESNIYLPVVSGTPTHRNNVKKATAIMVHCKEADGDILYFKHIHTSSHNITTGVRLEDISSGINSTTFYIETFFARTGLSLDRNIPPSTVIHLSFQDFQDSYKAIQIDNNQESYLQTNKGVFNIIIYDAGGKKNLIDNCFGSTYQSYHGYKYESIENQFVYKRPKE